MTERAGEAGLADSRERSCRVGCPTTGFFCKATTECSPQEAEHRQLIETFTKLARVRFGDLAGGFGAEDRQGGIGEEADLFQNGGLVPVNVLVGKLAIAKLDDRDQGYFDAPVGGGDAGEHPGNFLGMGERENHLVDELVRADGPGDGLKAGIGRQAGDEVSRIKAAQSSFAVTPGHGGNVIHVCVVDHGGQGGLSVMCDEFVGGVFFPQAKQVVVRHADDYRAAAAARTSGLLRNPVQAAGIANWRVWPLQRCTQRASIIENASAGGG